MRIGKNLITIIATSLGIASVSSSAIADEHSIGASAGRAGFSGEESYFSTSWTKVCFNNSTSSWRAWMIPMQNHLVTSGSGDAYGGWYWTGNSTAIQGRLTSWTEDGNLYDFGSFTTAYFFGTIAVPTYGTVAVHVRMKNGGSSQPCVTSAWVSTTS